ncbi:MAG: RNase adapter RapZ [Christensenellaceae bacterium]|jgi:UPF0042 nucleotide-binding protein
MKFTIITGISGAGKSSALKILEDMGFLCADNIPPLLIPEFARVCLESPNPPANAAVVADMRMGSMFDDIYEALEVLKEMDLALDILFLDASDEMLVSRFTQTRRRHPVTGSGNILTGILTERDKMQRIKDMANNIIDTSTYSTRQLSEILAIRYSDVSDSRLLISITSFGYKRGIPIDADMVFDMRFVPNPFYIPAFRTSTGLQEDVRNYVLSFDETQFFIDKILELILHLGPNYLEQDKKQLAVAIGCTGGMHRSVAVAEELFRRLEEKEQRATIEHRDVLLEKENVESRFRASTQG